ncbi:MAG: FMN-binding protein [Ruminococcaceae bacterium]|nr:FMN-binding protein [Oscillospiraceae bacterium]
MRKSIKSVVVLVCICAAVSVLLALANYVTAPIIAQNEQKKANAALLEVLPDGGAFESVDISLYTLPSTVSEVYRATNGGYVVKLTTTGYSSGMVMMCGISADGTVAGSKIISSAETPAIGGVAADSIASAAIGKDITSIDTVDTVSGATKTTAAYRAALKDALNTVAKIDGSSAKISEEGGNQ